MSVQRLAGCLLVTVVTATMLATGGPAAVADTTASVVGLVNNPDGSPRADVTIDLFTDGRATYLRSTTTVDDGIYRFEMEPGCYVVSLLAPEGFSFTTAPIRGLTPIRNEPVCVTGGDSINIGERRLVSSGVGNPGPFINVQVNDHRGTPVPGVLVDLFIAGDDGEREQYLRSVETGADGTGVFNTANAGCYVVTYIAAVGETFVDSGTEWLNRHGCGELTEMVRTTATLDRSGTIEAATVGGLISDRGQPVSGVVLDLFAATSDGSREIFLEDTATSDDGRYSFKTQPGCYVLTAIAPPDRTFVDTGTPWSEHSVCLKPGESVTLIDVQLT